MCKRRKIWILCAAMCSLAGMLPVQAGAEGSSPDALIVKKTYLRDYDEGTWETYGTGTFQTAGLSAEDEAAFPGLAAAIRQDSDALREELTALYEESCADARVARSEYEHEYEAAVETKILARRSDAQVVSFLVYEYTYMGGAHGYYFYTGYNYGTSTGEKLSLEQIVADPALFVQVIGEKVEEKYPGHVDYSLGDPLDNYTFSGGTYEYNYCLDPDGVLIIFNPYEIAAYASGVLTVKIGYDEYEGLFTDTVTAQDGSYMMQMFEWIAEDTDLNGDGTMESVIVSVGGTSESNWELSELRVQIGENDCTLGDRMISDALPLLVHTQDGKYYVYTDLAQENDYHTIEVFDLNNEHPVWVGSVDAGLGMAWDAQQEAVIASIPLHTERFLLDTRMNLLSTYTGQRPYTVGAGGMARPLEEAYTAPYPMTLKTVRELPGTALDPQTLEPLEETVMVPAGEEVTIWRTDDQTYADLRREDGSCLRVYVDQSAWPHLIDGEDEASYFEMLYYAG